MRVASFIDCALNPRHTSDRKLVTDDFSAVSWQLNKNFMSEQVDIIPDYIYSNTLSCANLKTLNCAKYNALQSLFNKLI